MHDGFQTNASRSASDDFIPDKVLVGVQFFPGDRDGSAKVPGKNAIIAARKGATLGASAGADTDARSRVGFDDSLFGGSGILLVLPTGSKREEIFEGFDPDANLGNARSGPLGDGVKHVARFIGLARGLAPRILDESKRLF